jgi:Uma2 family endonuclease
MAEAARKSRMTVAEFLDWYRHQPGRYELVQGVPVAMAPGRVRHNLAKARMWRALDDATRRAGLPCTVLTDGIGVMIDDEHWREPDAAVQCGSVPDFNAIMLDRPLIVVEVISPSSESQDTTEKLPEYFGVPSIMHYLIVDAEKRYIIHHQRGGAGDVLTRIVRSGDILLDPPGMTVPFDEMMLPL